MSGRAAGSRNASLGLVLLVLLLALWYGARYYQDLKSGRISPVLPARVPGAAAAALRGRSVALLAGHAGFDTGALCPDGLSEVEVNRRIAEEAARLLRDAGSRVLLLEEYDPRLDRLRADALVAIHADSCIPRRGFKVARWIESPAPRRDDVLVRCLVEAYQARTLLPQDPVTITEDMTAYHAFRKVAPTTAAAIIEVGYLGGDRELLTRNPRVCALGIAEGLACFFQQYRPTPP